jgi:tripartite ATP-independent transporter DctM subunit
MSVAAPYFLGASVVVILGWTSLALAALCGAPLFALLGAATLILNFHAEIPIAAVAVSHYSLVVNPSLPAIPLFTLAGYILAEGGASPRLVRVFRALVGNIRGGPAIVTTLACAFFTSFTGGSGVTILALGGLLLPILIEANYSEKNALGLITGAGSLGLLIPPCLPMILYAIAAQVEIRQIFLGAVFPGILLLAGTIWLGVHQQKRVASTQKFSWREALSSAWAAKWELLLPFAVVLVLIEGWATPVEAAAMTALYALIVETVIHRDLRNGAALRNVFSETALLVGGTLVILGVALAFTAFLVDAEIPQKAADFVTAHVQSKYVFLLLLNIFLLIVGAMMDIYSAIVVVVPLIIPIGRAYGIDPVHLGVVFLTNLELGYLIPPVGENLFISSYRFNKPLFEVYRATIPMIVVFLIAVVIVTYFPPMTTWLPRLLAG